MLTPGGNLNRETTQATCAISVAMTAMVSMTSLTAIIGMTSLTAIAAAALLAAPGTAEAVILNCPQSIGVKAVDAPYPWSDSPTTAFLPFAEASYSCSNGTCTLSCAYSMSSSIYTFLDYKVPPGVCNYTNQGRSFACSSLPPWHHHQSTNSHPSRCAIHPLPPMTHLD